MLKFVINLFAPKKGLPEEREPRPIQFEIRPSDGFGKTLLDYQDHLSQSEKNAAEELLNQLMKIGSCNRPPSDWFNILRWSKKHPLNDLYQEFIGDWWYILQGQLQASKAFFRHEQSYDHYGISGANIAIARGIIWLYVHLQGAKRMPDLLDFASSCQQAYPNCPKSQVQLANAVVDSLIKQPYFPDWEREIRLSYPNLQYGRVGVKLKRHSAIGTV